MSSPHPTGQRAQLPPAELALLKDLAAQFGPVLLQFFRRRVNDVTEAQDLTQEVYVRLLRRGNMSDVTDVRGYVFETAASVLTDRARKRRSHRSDLEEEFNPAEHGNADFGSDSVLIGKETLTRVTRALLELPDRTRTIFILRRLEGLPYQDIAKRLGVSLSLVEKQMRRAVAHLTQWIGEE